MRGLSLSDIVIWLRNPEWGAISFILSLLVLIATLFTPWGGIVNTVIIILALAIVCIILGVNLGLSGIGVACLQTDPMSLAENQYQQAYPIPDGYTEFDVYFSVPKWLDEFSVEIIHDGPFKMGAWDLPDPVSFNNGVVHCDGDLDRVRFILRFGGNPQDIGEAAYNVTFKHKKTERKIHSIILDGDKRIETESNSDDLDSDIIETLDLGATD